MEAYLVVSGHVPQYFGLVDAVEGLQVRRIKGQQLLQLILVNLLIVRCKDTPEKGRQSMWLSDQIQISRNHGSSLEFRWFFVAKYSGQLQDWYHPNKYLAVGKPWLGRAMMSAFPLSVAGCVAFVVQDLTCRLSTRYTSSYRDSWKRHG